MTSKRMCAFIFFLMLCSIAVSEPVIVSKTYKVKAVYGALCIIDAAERSDVSSSAPISGIFRVGPYSFLYDFLDFCHVQGLWCDTIQEISPVDAELGSIVWRFLGKDGKEILKIGIGKDLGEAIVKNPYLR